MRGLRIGLTVAAVAAASVLALVSVVNGRPDAPGAAGARLSRPAGGLRVGAPLDRPLPNVVLRDHAGRRTALRAFRGRWLVLAPAMTACHEVCPLTSGALLSLRRALHRAGLTRRVTVAEVTVDPWRDTPARLRAYRRRFGVNLELLTGAPAQVLRLWRALGIYVHRVVDKPPATLDWYTHRRTRADVVHGDGVFVLGPDGHEREAALGMPDVRGHLPRRLRRMLDDDGRHNLLHPRLAWAPSALLADLRTLMPAKPSP